ncbi:MAG TPA: hypothetical protein VFA96_04705 [Nocardioides sp.]|nr:hypothetical protein [Nocardioides sp.]
MYQASTAVPTGVQQGLDASVPLADHDERDPGQVVRDVVAGLGNRGHVGEDQREPAEKGTQFRLGDPGVVIPLGAESIQVRRQIGAPVVEQSVEPFGELRLGSEIHRLAPGCVRTGLRPVMSADTMTIQRT